MSSHKRYLFLGGESSGKTTICKEIAKETDTFYASEYGRAYFDIHDPEKAGLLDMLTICNEQTRIEELVLTKSEEFGKKISWYDTSLITTYFYTKVWGIDEKGFLKECAQRLLRAYDHIFVCDNDFDFVQDGTRDSLKFALTQREFYLMALEAFGIPYTILRGTVEERKIFLKKFISEQQFN